MHFEFSKEQNQVASVARDVVVIIASGKGNASKRCSLHYFSGQVCKHSCIYTRLI